jgi:hypothetical protein
MDTRPPDSYGLNYTGQACRDRQHERCPGYWPTDRAITGTTGGTRCACPCHEQVERERLEGATEGGDAIERP